jgi:hypothetical protein
MGEPQLLADLLGAGALALQVRLQRLDLGGRPPLGGAGDVGRRLQLALRLLDLSAEALAGATGSGAHRAQSNTGMPAMSR